MRRSDSGSNRALIPKHLYCRRRVDGENIRFEPDPGRLGLEWLKDL